MINKFISRTNLNPCPEMNLVVLSSLEKPGFSEIRMMKELISRQLDWDLFVSLVGEHRVFGPVYKTIKSHLKTTIPIKVVGTIKNHNLTNTIKSLRNINEAITISKLFTEHKIPHLFLKGICLSQLLYNNPVYRHSGDIDLIVAESDMQEAGNLLESLGYNQVQSDEELTENKFELFKKLNHHLGYKSEKNLTRVELHIKFCPVEKAFPISFKEAIHQKRTISVNNYHLPILNETHTLLYLFLHGYQHGWIRFFWLKDILDFLNKNTQKDHSKFLQTASKYYFSRPVCEGYLLLNCLYKISIPDTIQTHLQKDLTLRLLSKHFPYFQNQYNKPKFMIVNNLHRLYLNKSLTYKLRYLFNVTLITLNKKKFNPEKKSRFLNAVKRQLRSIDRR